MANVYSASRPLHGVQPQSAQHANMAKYAYSSDVQDLMQKMITDILTDQPDDAVDFMISWLQKEQKRREQEGTPKVPSPS